KRAPPTEAVRRGRHRLTFGVRTRSSVLRLRDDLVGFLGPLFGPARQVARLAQHLALRVEEEDRRVAFDVLLVLLLQLLILLLHLVRLLLLVGEVDGEEDDVLLGPVLELFGAEDLGMQLLAPPSPVTAGEVGEDDLLLLLGRRDRLLVVGAPLLGDRLLLFGLLLVLLRRRLVVGLAGRLVLRGRHRAARDRLGGEACRCDRH